MYASKFLVSFALLVLPAQVAAQCQNDEAFRYFDIDGSKERTCRNIRMSEPRRLLLCKDASVNAACPQTCGQCCADSTAYEFTRKNTLKGTCAWIAKKEIRIKKYCPGVKSNSGRTIRDACPVTCDFCFSAVSSVTGSPTISPAPSKEKSAAPTGNPTTAPSGKPSAAPTGKPSINPTDAPSRPPSPQPSPFPTSRPTFKPSQSPSRKPSQVPSLLPSLMPSQVPSDLPSLVPSQVPSLQPSAVPSDIPSLVPSQVPSMVPSQVPSLLPSLTPSAVPSDIPSLVPSQVPSSKPSQVPSLQPSNKPTVSIKPSATPSQKPVVAPVASPVKSPTSAPIVAACVNTSYTFPGKLEGETEKTRDCMFIIKNGDSVADRQTRFCSDPAVKVNCVQACGLCSTPTDEPAFVFKLKNPDGLGADVFQNCAWITKNSDPAKLVARKAYCSRANVKVGCAATCAAP